MPCYIIDVLLGGLICHYFLHPFPSPVHDKSYQGHCTSTSKASYSNTSTLLSLCRRGSRTNSIQWLLCSVGQTQTNNGEMM